MPFFISPYLCIFVQIYAGRHKKIIFKIMATNKDFSETSTDIYNYYGVKPDGEIQTREVKKEPTERTQQARQIYFETKSSASVEFPYWYTRRWEELEGEVQIIRRAEALKAGFEHLTASVFPGELVAMRKVNYLRGSYPMPWLSEAFFLSKEDDLFKEAQKAGKASADEVTTMGQGGGNVTKSIGNIISIAGKFGLRKEEMPILIKTAKKWFNKSVDDVGHKYEQLVPGYQTKEEIMRAVICMFDSGYTLPQGREVMNYYYPLQYGIEGIKNICKEKQDQTAGYPEMDRLYFYKAVHTMLEGLQTWIVNYAK
jgi:4-hydroxyphenylacetate decarboxylase large subunit